MHQTNYPTYLVHFNGNHDKLGRFDRGDGDHDGIADDHKNQKKPKIQRINTKEYNSKYETRSAKYAMGRAKPGEKQGYHEAENLLKYPYYIDSRGYKHYYDTAFELPKGEYSKNLLGNVVKMLALPVEMVVATKTLIEDDKALRDYWGGWMMTPADKLKDEKHIEDVIKKLTISEPKS